MVCRKIDIRKHKTSEQSVQLGEGAEFTRVNVEGCTATDFNIDIFEKNGKMCVGISSKDMKEEKEICVD